MGEDEKTCAGCKHQFIRCDNCGYCKRDPDLVDNFEENDHVPCEAMGSECCEEGNMGKVFKEIVTP